MSSIGVAGAVAASRIYLSYHTPRQVLVGVLAGILVADVWFVATGLLRRRGWVDYLLGWQVCRMLRLRDLCLEEDIWESGWREWDRRRAEKIKSKKKS